MAKKLSRWGEILFLVSMFFLAVPISDLLLDVFQISSLAAASASIVAILVFSLIFYHKILMIDRIFITILSIRRLKEFIFIVIFMYGMFITAFATFYYCVDRLNHPSSSYFKWFYFSVVTLTTVGLGDVAPSNMVMQILVSIESFIGYISIPIIFTIGLGLMMKEK